VDPALAPAFGVLAGGVGRASHPLIQRQMVQAVDHFGLYAFEQFAIQVEPVEVAQASGELHAVLGGRFVYYFKGQHSDGWIFMDFYGKGG
jgi:hypothetical protein